MQEHKVKEQLLYQLPPQDFNPMKHCSDDNQFETNELDLFRSIVQENAVGLANINFMNQSDKDGEMVIFLSINFYY